MAKQTNKASEEVTADVLYDEFDRFEMFITDNWRKILLGCGAIIIIVAVIAIVMQIQKKNQFKAESELADAKTVAELEKVISKYPGTPATNAARLRLAMLLKDDKKYTESIAALQLIARTEQSNDLQWRALLNIGYIYELDGKKEDAAKHFANMGNNTALPALVRDEANYSAGRLYLALGKKEQAETALQIPAATPAKEKSEAFWKDQSKKMLDRIKYSDTTPAKPTAQKSVKTEIKAAPKTK